MTELLAELRPGEMLGSYRVESLAAAGGSSLVYKATHVPSGSFVALKIGRGNGPDIGQRLRREARLLAEADHTNIVGYRASGVHEGHSYLVTDWIEGRSLADTVASSGRLSVEQALHLGGELAEALDHLHARGIVHRDLSLANVLVDDEGKPMLIDLGVGRSERSSAVTMDGAIAGTPRYVAPEVIRDEEVDGRADQYSLAVILHEVITGQSPFPETDNAATALYQQLDVLPEPLTEVDPEVPTGVEAAVLRALEKDPADRFDRVSDFVRAAWDGDHAFDPHTARRRPAVWMLLIGLLTLVALAAAVISVTRSGSSNADESTADSSDTTQLSPDTEVPVTTSDAGGTASSRPSVPGSSPDASTTSSNTEASSPTSQATVVDETTTDPSIDPLVPAVGSAAALPCNLLPVADFDGGVPGADFFAPRENERVVDGAGVGGTPALEVGREGLFGQYAEPVDASPGVSYGFSGWFASEGELNELKIGVTFVDADYRTVGNTEIDVAPGALHQAVVVTEAAPEGTRFALPWVFKDASQGLLYADELVFAPRQSCAEGLFVEGPRS